MANNNDDWQDIPLDDDWQDVPVAPPEVQNISFDASDVSTESDMPEMSKAPKIGMGESALRGSEQGLTMGFADELGGAIGAGIEGAMESPDQGESKLNQLQRLYNEYRDFNRERYKEAEEANPGAFMAGDMAGSMLMPGGVAKGGAKALSKVGLKTAAKKAAATGALESAGRTEEDLTSAEGIRDVAVGTGTGLVGGKILGKIGSKFGKEALEEGAEKAAKESNIAAMKSIGAKAKDFRDEFGFKTNKRATTKTAKGTGTTLVDEGVIKAKQGIDETKEQIVSKLDEVGSQRISPTAKKLDELGNELPLETFADDVNRFDDKMNEALENIAGGSAYAKGADKAVYENMHETAGVLRQDILEALESPNKIEELVEIKRKLQSQVNWNDPQATSYNEFLVNAQGNINEMINGMSQKIDSNLAKEMIDANKTYSNLINANKIAGDEVTREMAKEGGLGFRDYLASGVISTIGNNKVLGPAFIGSKKIIEKATGKDTGRLLDTFEAFRKAKKAKSLSERAANYGGLDKLIGENTDEIATGAVGATAAMLDSQKPDAPYKKNREIGQYIESADPQTLNAAADKVTQQYGKDGEKLALTLQKVSEKDRIGRRALLFSILQDPNNRRMLGIDKEE